MIYIVVEYVINPFTGRVNKKVHGKFKNEGDSHARWGQMKHLGLNVGIEKR